MKIESMSVTMTPFKDGVTKNVGKWSFRDDYENGFCYRNVYHYDTLMGVFYTTGAQWQFAPLSVGRGSVSDQNGMNKIFKDFGWSFRRNGGKPRMEHVSGIVFSN
jgi:hypothetical protein